MGRARLPPGAALAAALALVVLVTLGGAARADLDLGLSAYRAGRYAIAWREFSRLAVAGDAAAQYNLGQMYRQGQGVARDYELAARWYRAAAVQGLGPAQFNLGVMHEKGLGVAADPVLAAHWYQTAETGGYGPAARALEALRADPQRAAAWQNQRRSLLRRALGGQAEAQYRLGLIYAVGVGGPRDPAAALSWLGRAARSGIAGAQTHLGLIYAEGQGVEPDRITAYAWLHLAAAAGDEHAEAHLQHLGARMEPAERAAARRRSADLIGGAAP